MVKQEFHPSGSGRHRLVEGEVVTPWAVYIEFTFLNGMVGVTAFYGDKERVMTAVEFCEQQGVGLKDVGC